MAKIESLPASKTLNYRANEIREHMYRGQTKHDFLDFLSSSYESTINNYIAGNFRKNKERDIAIIAIMLGTGIRVEEVANTDVTDLNLKTAMLSDTRKGGQRDTIPIAHWVLPYIQDYIDIRQQRYAPNKQ